MKPLRTLFVVSRALFATVFLLVLLPLTVQAAAPTFVSAAATSDTTIEVVFSEAVKNLDHTQFTSADFTVSGGSISGSTVTLTVGSLGDTAFISSDLDIAAAAVQDVDTSANNIAVLDKTVADGQAPTLISGKVTGGNEITLVYSEAITTIVGDLRICN